MSEIHKATKTNILISGLLVNTIITTYGGNFNGILSTSSEEHNTSQNKMKNNKTKSRAQYYILILNYNTRRLSVKSYTTSQIDEANKVYNSIESTRAEEKIDAVLVNVSSFNVLKSAYPNYFSDIGEFVDIIKEFNNKIKTK